MVRSCTDAAADPLQLGSTVVPPRKNVASKVHISAIVLGAGATAVLCIAAMSTVSAGTGPEVGFQSKFQLADCFAYTGGTCHLHKCNKNRNATCQSGECVCGGAYPCTHPNGNCQAKTNEVLLSDFTLESVHYPGYFLYLPKHFLYQLRVDTDTAGTANKFVLRTFGSLGGNPTFMLTTTMFPDYAIKIGAFHQVRSVYLGKELTTVDPQRLALDLCVVDDKPEAIMISGNKMTGGPYSGMVKNADWFTVDWLSSRISGVKGDAQLKDNSAWWIPNPPVPPKATEKIPKCSTLH